MQKKERPGKKERERAHLKERDRETVELSSLEFDPQEVQFDEHCTIQTLCRDHKTTIL